MATIKEILEQREHVSSQVDVFEEVLSMAYDMKGLKETHGEEAVDDVLTAIDEVLLTPLREELEKIDGMEVESGKKKATKKDAAKSPAKRGKAAKGYKTSRAKGR